MLLVGGMFFTYKILGANTLPVCDESSVHIQAPAFGSRSCHILLIAIIYLPQFGVFICDSRRNKCTASPVLNL